MRWWLLVSLVTACSTDVFTSEDGGGSDSSVVDAVADVTTDSGGGSDASGLGEAGFGDASATCEVTTVTTCSKGCSLENCCVAPGSVSCAATCTTGVAMACFSTADCLLGNPDGGVVACCLNSSISRDVCPEVIQANSGSAACSLGPCGSKLQLCNSDQECPTGRCHAATFAVNTNAFAGVCGL